MIHATAVALVHEHDIHPGGQSIAGDADHVLRLRRSLEPMHNQHRHGFSTVVSPVTPAANVDPRRNLHESLLGRWQGDPARHEEAGKGLDVSPRQPSPRPEWPAYSAGTRRAPLRV